MTFSSRISHLSIRENKLLLKTIIRLDKSHVVKILFNLNSFKSSQCGKAVKYFYFNVLKKFIEEKDFKVIQSIAKCIFIVLFSEHESKDVMKSVNQICNYTGKVLNTPELEDDEWIEQKNVNDSFDSLDDFWCTKLYEKVQDDLENTKFNETKLNPYYLPSMKSDILRILKLCPMWTAIMLKLNSRLDITCTSSNIESQFNILKNIILHNYKLPVRLDIFLELYLNHVESQSIIYKESLRNNQHNEMRKEMEIEKTPIVCPGTIFTTDTVGEEEWKGLNKKSAARSTLSETNFNMRSNNLKINTESQTKYFYALCAFNSVFHSIYFMMFNSQYVSNIFTTTFTELLQSQLSSEILISDELMHKILFEFRNIIDFGAECINCEMGIKDVLEKILVTNISVKCNMCKTSKSQKFLSYYFTDVNCLKYIQSRIDESLSIKCKRTKGHELDLQVDNLLFMEIAVSNELGTIKLSDVPVFINIKNEEYEIWSVIVYHIPNHFKSVVFYKNRFIELDDLIGRPVLRRRNLNVIPQLLIYRKKKSN